MQKILLLISHQMNKKLLYEFLFNQYEMVIPKNEEKQLSQYEKDLIIVDYTLFFKYRQELKIIKQQADPIFLPIVLITSKKESPISDEIVEWFDDIINIPTSKRELNFKIKNLLKIRALSQKSAEQYYFISKLTKNNPTGICVLQDGHIVYFNASLSEILETPSDDLNNSKFDNFTKNNSELKTIIENPSTLSEENQQNSFEVEIDPNNKKKWCELRFSKIIYNNTTCLLTVVTDITDRKQKEEKIEYLSFHDSLTGLYNRAFLESEMKRLDVKRQLPISIIMIDVNGLKLINDTYGHETGDELLRKTAKIFNDSCRSEDIVARWGGDEFVIFLPQTSKKDAAKISKRIKEECKCSYVKSLPVSVALGVSTKDDLEKSIKQVLKEAEDVLYKNKVVESRSARNDIISGLLSILKEKSDETEEHALRMTDLCVKLGETLSLDEETIDKLSLIATMHDIGNVVIPEEVLKKPGNLNDKEWNMIKEHPEKGKQIASASENLIHIAKEIESHHERWDGNGYPNGLKGEEIPLLSRIIAIIDAFDVITNKRSYKKAATVEEAIKEIKKCAGTQFDPYLVDVFLNTIKSTNDH